MTLSYLRCESYRIVLGLALPLAVFTAAVVSEASAQHDAAHHSAYAGEEHREIKALSPDEVSRLLDGEGMGMALPAELNGYPGPRHVLELAGELELTEAQSSATRAIFEHMKQEAVTLGGKIVHLERQLDQAFAGQTITAAAVDSLTSEIAVLRGRLRAAHLSAHLRQTEVLTEAQRGKYNVLRGYSVE